MPRPVFGLEAPEDPDPSDEPHLGSLLELALTRLLRDTWHWVISWMTDGWLVASEPTKIIGINGDR